MPLPPKIVFSILGIRYTLLCTFYTGIAVPLEARRGCQSPWTWSYRQHHSLPMQLLLLTWALPLTSSAQQNPHTVLGLHLPVRILDKCSKQKARENIGKLTCPPSLRFLVLHHLLPNAYSGFYTCQFSIIVHDGQSGT